ncbi:stress protein [Bacillus sp. 179-C3.3 HS]|uniref:stress protein n=1 Tax=Bacillus sp. 179-C3.3 HS TaxID=3232162 RepID=UPI0039A23871
MKKLFVVLFTCFLFLAACNNNPTTTSNEETQVKQETQKKPEKQEPEKEQKPLTTKNLIQAFKSAGLEAEKPSDLKQKEFGNIREEGKRILVPSLGEDAGGRLFRFENESDLEQAKSYYDGLSNSGPMFFSHTYAKGLFLLQMNGEMEDKEFEKYKKVMDQEIN